MFDAGALRLLACGALAVLLVGLLVFLGGPSEANETRAWVLAFALALPGGLILASYQERRLAAAAPAAAGRGLAGGLILLALAFGLRRAGSGDHLHHAVLVVAALGAVGAPFLAARLWRDPGDRQGEFAWVACLVAVAFLLLLFVPRSALELGNLIPALALAAVGVFLLRLRRPLPLPPPARAGLDALACLVIALVVLQFPDLLDYTGNLLIHHLYYLGPANDVVHGRAMLGTAWSQYGIGLIDGLGLFFTVVPIGFGTFALLVTALTAVQYLCVYAILRLAGLGFLLTLVAVAVAALGNLFATLEAYVVFPSTSPLRFGIPYLMILLAVLGVRFPRWTRASQLGVLALLALAAVGSFETFAYGAGTYGALVLVGAMREPDEVFRRVLRGGLIGIGVCVAAVALFSLATLVLSGHLDWNPYVEFLQLYSTDEFFTLPIEFFSTGLLMAAVPFLSAVMLLWLARAMPTALSPAMWTALTGFTGFAVISFTYYLGRSHPNNLLVLLVPVVVICALWMQVLLTAPKALWRTGTVAVLALGMAMIAVAGWPSAEAKKGTTALGLAIPGGGSLKGAVETLAGNPALDARTPVGTELLDSYWPAEASALVLTDPDLTTEILLDAERSNLLPISHPPEEDLIESSDPRVRAAAERVPPGTLMLTSPVPADGSGLPAFSRVEIVALDVLRRRFHFVPVARNSSGLEVVRLVPRGKS
ncbi:MAG: hypothetical protein QOE75_1955 [Solirubrobacterales bacterium]|nr:hypothetical protein [Solirubrobacterales bacterium]